MLNQSIGLRVTLDASRFFLLLFAMTLLTACNFGEGPTVSHGDGSMTHVRFVDSLRGEGFTVTIAGEIEQPFLSVKGTAVEVSKTDEMAPQPVQSFEYESSEAVEADAKRIMPDGTPQGYFIDWVAPPHFYKKGRILVLYTGDDEEMLAVLTRLLGEQFAGA